MLAQPFPLHLDSNVRMRALCTESGTRGRVLSRGLGFGDVWSPYAAIEPFGLGLLGSSVGVFAPAAHVSGVLPVHVSQTDFFVFCFSSSSS